VFSHITDFAPGQHGHYDTMTLEIALVLGILAVSLILFISEVIHCGHGKR